MNFLKQIIYSLTFSAIVCAPNNNGVLPSNHTFIDNFYFFFLFLFLFIYILILKIFKSKNIEYFSYILLLILLLDFIRLKYQLFAFSNLSLYVYFIFFVPLFFFFLFKKILVKNFFYIFELLGKFSWFFVIFFSPYILIFAYQNFQYNFSEYTFNKKISKIESAKQVYKKKLLVIVFDELDNKILDLELENLPAFQKLIKKSTKYQNIIIPGSETLDVIPNLISMNSLSYGNKESHLLFKNKNFYINYFNEIKQDNKNLFFYLNNGNKKELFVFGFYHKYCHLFSGQYGECYELKYKKKPSYRFLVENIEILDTHINHLNLYYKLTDYFLFNESLKSGFFHLRLPHGPFIYDYKKKEYKFVKDSEEGYLGNLVLADKYLDFLLKQQKKYSFNLIIMSDHGYRSKYKDIENVENLDYINTAGRSVLIFKNFNIQRKKTIDKEIKLVDAFKNILNEVTKN